MKKLALILAIAMIAAFAAPAMASDFMAGGQARYEAINVDNDDDSDVSYFDQRYRVAFTWKVNDNVTTQLRADFAEANWGSRDYSWPGKGYRYEEGSDTIMVDRAWVKINQGPLTLTVGQQASQLGNSLLWSDQFQGIVADLDFMPISVRLVYAKESEGDTDSDDDVDIYGGRIGFANDSFGAGFTYVAFTDDDTDSDLAGYAVDFTVPLEVVKIKGGLGMFDGEDSDGDDYAGTQAFVDITGALTDAFKLGLTFVWADEVDSDETQAVTIQDDLGWNYTDYGGALGYNNGLVKGQGIFDISGDSQGVVGGILHASFAVMDNLTFYGKLGYFEPNGNDTSHNDTLIANASVDWVWVPAVTVSAGVFYVDHDDDIDMYDGETFQSTLQLTVAF